MQSYVLHAWCFSRLLCLVYFVAFLSLMVQARGLWGVQGILPISHYAEIATLQLGWSRHFQIPSLFYFFAGDFAIVGWAAVGALAAALAFFGLAQGWMLLLCFIIYLSYVSLGQDFLSFQWDTLLIEVGFVALFAVPWGVRWQPWGSIEPHWIIPYVFGALLFKLMFLSGVVKILSGDQSWRDFTALSYHFWTQPLPNPLSPLFHSLPMWAQKINTAMTFLVELILPFLIFVPRLRWIAAIGFFFLNIMIIVSGNFAFFNWLTIFLAVWLLPEEWLAQLWGSRVMNLLHGPHPYVIWPVGVLLLVLSLFWCTRWFLPRGILQIFSPMAQLANNWHISNSYGLFAVMTKDRPEIVLEGSNDKVSWQEYEFKFKPGDLKRMPPLVAPHQPRLDWQMWFAALGRFEHNDWMEEFMKRVIDGSPVVLSLLAKNPFPDQPPKYLRAQLYKYEFQSVSEIVKGEGWWRRTLLGTYSPIFSRQ